LFARNTLWRIENSCEIRYLRILMYLSEYKYLLVTWSNFMKPEGLYGEFDHVPTGIYIPIDTL
jgi:hypothetical protein